MLMRRCADPLCFPADGPSWSSVDLLFKHSNKNFFFFFFLLSIACLPGNKNINVDVFSAEGGKKGPIFIGENAM